MKKSFVWFLLIIAPIGLSAQEDPWVETAVRDALVGALTGNQERVASVRSVLEQDSRDESALETGVADDLAVLEILAGTGTQKEKAERIQDVANQLNDPVARERLLDLSKRSNDYRLEQLIKKRRINRYTGVINRTWRVTSQVLTGQPSALGVAGIDVAKAVTGRSDPTVTDKKIAHLASLQEKRGETAGKDLDRAREFYERIEEKKDRELKNDCLRTVERAEKAEDWWRVREFAIHGTSFWPEEEAFQEALLTAEDHLFGEVVDQEETAPPLEDISSEQVEVLRRKIVSESEKSFTPTARSREEIQTAEANRRNRTLDYLVFGDTSVSDVSERSAKTAIVHGGDAPAALAFFQAAESLMRGATLLFGNDLGVEDAIQTYAKIEKENPEALSRRDYLKWADLYSKKDREDKAIELLQSHGIEDEGRIEKYEKRWAKGIVNRCRDLPPSKERIQALEYVTTSFPDTSAAREADQLLREMPRTDQSLIRVQREDLKAYRTELVDAGFNLPIQWWDDEKGNGELGEDSLYWNDEEAAIWYRVTSKSPWRKIDQSDLAKDRIRAVFVQVENRAVARAMKQDRSLGRRFPLEIEGALGDGSYITPQLVEYDLSDPDDLYYE
ncbi:MAG: hypothetical protein KC931_11485 [Candidatus Omnitrophica bacterium]|nr:hypothetical protein [Candidatus Omnitrophota bacterium]